MEKYLVEATKSTPYVDLNHEEHKLVFKGQSFPENAYNLYEPIFKWVDKYFEEVDNNYQTTAEFFLSYINTSSTKCLLILLEKLNKAYSQGKKILINWYYDEENGFDYDMGKDFEEDIEVPFNFISVENNA